VNANLSIYIAHQQADSPNTLSVVVLCKQKCL